MIKIYTDGSSSKNRAGWGFVAVLDDVIIYEKSGQGAPTDTNQMMELTAAIEACDWVDNVVIDNPEFYGSHTFVIYSDSAYLVNCYRDKWWANWETNGWKNSKGEPVANALSWRYLIKFFKRHDFSFEKIKGHAGHVYNERADALAQGRVLANDECNDLTHQKKYDIIYMKLSEKLKNICSNESLRNNTVTEIIEILRQEGINIE